MMLSPYIRQDGFPFDDEAYRGLPPAENTKEKKETSQPLVVTWGPLDCRELVSLAPDDAADPDRSTSRF